MARLGARVHGIDVVERNLAVARAHAAGAGLDIRYEAVTAAELLSRGAGYDVVLNMEVVEHVPQVGAFLSNCARLVRPGGAMAVATINRTFRSWLFAIVGAEYALGWLPRGTHRWGRFVRPAEVESALARDGLQVEARTGVRVNPFNRRFSLCAAMPVNYMLVARRRAAAARTAGSP
jgi:2-polyprenyl-6-hydroxyphenyl methylase/3-demethylubiquinone-9 3-methyltransferase